jgi:hypothetical protein
MAPCNAYLLMLVQNFEVVAAFSPFTWDGRVWTENDALVNGKQGPQLPSSSTTVSVAQLLKNDVDTKIRVVNSFPPPLQAKNSHLYSLLQRINSKLGSMSHH